MSYMSPVVIAHQAGQVTRYHTNPVVSRLNQTTADHSHGVIMILLKLHPNPSRNLLAQAAVHDSGERWAGDLPYPFKKANPEAAAAHHETEVRLAIEHEIPQFHHDLTMEDQKWLFFADKLESYLYVQIFCPWIQVGNGWPEQKDMLLRMAQELGINQEIF
jgi:5'-deoxynucleotidase YfbR-like HD superfamily hydrolase